MGEVVLPGNTGVPQIEEEMTCKQTKWAFLTGPQRSPQKCFVETDLSMGLLRPRGNQGVRKALMQSFRESNQGPRQQHAWEHHSPR